MKYAMHVRKIRADEGGLLLQMRIAALTEAPYAFGSRLEDTQAQPLASFESAAAKHADSEVSTTFFAFDGVNAVGLIGAFRETSPPQRCFICSLWLAPGIGALSSLQNWCTRPAPGCISVSVRISLHGWPMRIRAPWRFTGSQDSYRQASASPCLPLRPHRKPCCGSVPGARR